MSIFGEDEQEKMELIDEVSIKLAFSMSESFDTLNPIRHKF